LKQAAEGGYGPAQLTLGKMYLTGSSGVPIDAEEGARWFRMAMEGGDREAELAYATMLATGNGVPRDDEAARAIFERAAERGDPGAQWSLGVLHEEGRGGLVKDLREAMKWWRKAAKQGHALSQAKLGVAYVKGEGVRRDLVEGYAWLAASGLPETKGWIDTLDKEMPKSLLAKARKLADERRAPTVSD
jgi:TPR repeat protein